MTTTGTFAAYTVPDLPGGLEAPEGITVGSDGALWFAETYGTIHRVTTDGVFTQYSVPLPGDGDPTQWIAARPWTFASNPAAPLIVVTSMFLRTA